MITLGMGHFGLLYTVNGAAAPSSIGGTLERSTEFLQTLVLDVYANIYIYFSRTLWNTEMRK